MRIIVLANGVLTNPESIHHWLSGEIGRAHV